jgi:Xaa-Pro aminopeptidase
MAPTPIPLGIRQAHLMNPYAVFPVRQQDEIIRKILHRRLEAVLPTAMREAGIDMWLLLCQEDNLDPVYKTMLPLNTWTPILQMLVFCDRGEAGVERLNLSMTETADLYETPWQGRDEEEQWRLLAQIVRERDPKRIGINVGGTNWAAGGLTYHLHRQLTRRLPEPYAERLVSAEAACVRWLMTLTDEELELYPSVVSIAHAIIAEIFSRKHIVPGVTTTEDLEWAYWQKCADLGFKPSFKPYYRIYRSPADRERFPVEDGVVRRGDVVHCDVGFKYLRLTTDHQEVAYLLREGESDAPEGLKRLFAETERLRAVYREEFRRGRTGNEMLERMLARAREAGIPSPKIYSHSLGLLLHEPGPLIGLPWEQERCPGRGDVRLEYNTCFTMELSVADAVPEWGGQVVRLPTEQDVMFVESGCHPIDGVQIAFHLV